MKTWKKAGLTALAGSLVATSAYAGAMTVTGSANLTFTVQSNDMEISKRLLEKNHKKISFKTISSDSEVSKISVVGMGMMSQSGVAEKMFKTLANKKINILAISTSEIKISVLIEKKYTEEAIKSLHSAYNLDISK